MDAVDRPPVLIIGAGLAGLSCAWRLTQLGRRCEILEASDGVGGRVRTDVVEGFRLDRGFQVLLTSYPTTASVLDYGQLDLRSFDAGARVRRGGQFHSVYDPLRHPSGAFGAALSPLFTAADKLRFLELWANVMAVSPAELLSSGAERTTEAEWVERGFSSKSVEAFLRPFFGGVFLTRQLTPSARFFRYVFRMFATGRAAVPAAGMGAISDQLAGRVRGNGVRIRLQTRVVERSDDGVTLDGGERLPAAAVVVATELPAAQRLIGEMPNPSTGNTRSACTVYFAAPATATGNATLVLNGDGPADGPVNHLAEMSAVAPSYAPPGQTLLAASVLGAGDEDVALVNEVRRQMASWFGPAASQWRHLRTSRIPFALPPADPPTLLEPHRPVQLSSRLFVCGDHRDQPSIEGAIVSGLRAAEAVAAGTGR